MCVLAIPDQTAPFTGETCMSIGTVCGDSGTAGDWILPIWDLGEV